MQQRFLHAATNLINQNGYLVASVGRIAAELRSWIGEREVPDVVGAYCGLLSKGIFADQASPADAGRAGLGQSSVRPGIVPSPRQSSISLKNAFDPLP